MNTYSQERKSYLMVVMVAIFWGMFPIVINKGSQYIPPLFFAAVSLLTATVVTLIVSLVHKNTESLFTKKALIAGCIVGFCMAAFPYALMFLGAKMTNGINTSALMLSEIIFTLIISPLFGEKATLNKTIGGILVFLGSGIILFKGGSLNTGDILIFLSTITLPIGNHFAKKAIETLPPENLMIMRYGIGGTILLILSFLVEDRNQFASSMEYWPYIAINGVLLFGIVNTIWYKALKFLEVSRAVFILMTFPIFSLIFLTVFFDEVPKIYQLLGVAIIIAGAYLTTKKR